MPRIIDLVRSRKAAIAGNKTESDRTGKLSIAALTAGVGSTDWKSYMEHFGSLDPTQLKRLLAQDGTLGDPDLDKKRAYLISNGICGMASPDTGNLDNRVNTIDNALPGAVCDPEP
jgi:hypothetical protein